MGPPSDLLLLSFISKFVKTQCQYNWYPMVTWSPRFRVPCGHLVPTLLRYPVVTWSPRFMVPCGHLVPTLYGEQEGSGQGIENGAEMTSAPSRETQDATMPHTQRVTEETLSCRKSLILMGRR